MMQTLRRLDDRVLGKPRTSTPEQAKRGFLVGLGGCIVVLVLALIFRRPWLVTSGGGFVGAGIGGLVRWRNAPPPSRDLRSMRWLTGLFVLVLGGLVATFFATLGPWGVSDEKSPGQRLDPYRDTRTNVILCERTTNGDAYTYQAPITDAPKCNNGAVPRVVVHG